MNFDSSVLQIPVEDIIPNRFQPRLSFEDTSLNELANSIKQHGIIQPLVLRKVGDKYEIVAGERRYRAATMAGLSSVPAVISKIDERTSAEVAIAENVQRRALTAIEEAKSYKALLDQGFMSQEELARRMGLSQSAISNKLRLLSLAPEVQEAVMDNKISERHARALLTVKEPESQVKWLNKIIEERLTVRALDEALSAEYGKGAIMPENNIDQVKQNAVDIIPQTTTPQNMTMPITDNFNTVDLGQKINPNKFFNSLEDQAVNMQMNEDASSFINPAITVDPIANNNQGFLNSNEKDIPVEQPIISSEPLSPITTDNGSIDSLDTLDFSPSVKKQDFSEAKQKITTAINELKANNINVTFTESDLDNQIIYNIVINKTDN